MSNEIILQTDHLTKKFSSVTAVEDLDLKVSRGDIFGFLGPNGAGKSTTIRMLLGLIRPTKGAIKLFNRPFEQHRDNLLGKIGALVEKPSFYNYLSARKNMEIFAKMARCHHRIAYEIDRVLDIVSLLDRAGDKVKTYSHGMKQRLGVAQALLGKPELIILDEPTAGLDPKGIKEIRRLISELSQQGLTIFLSSHILHEVEQICRNMAIIDRGRLIVQGDVEQLLNSEENIFIVKIDRPEEASEILRTRGWSKSIKVLSGKIEIMIREQQVPGMVEFLVLSGFHIFGIQHRRSLEDYFLSLLGVENA